MSQFEFRSREIEHEFDQFDAIADRNSNANGRATVSIRGDTRDIDQVTSEIEELTKERQGSGGFDRPRDEPKPMETAAAPTDFELIDWQAAARESVSCKATASMFHSAAGIIPANSQ